MLYLFKIEYPQETKFTMQVAIKDTQTLWDLHQAIQQKLNYDPGQMASFLIVDEKEFIQQEEYPSINMENLSEDSPMKTVSIDNIAKRKGQKLIYLFDMFSERFFVLDLIATSEEEDTKLSYPYLFNEQGVPPDQTFFDMGIENDSQKNIDDDDEFGFDDDDMYGIDEDDVF